MIYIFTWVINNCVVTWVIARNLLRHLRQLSSAATDQIYGMYIESSCSYGTICYFGPQCEMRTGVFQETLNFGKIWKLKRVQICAKWLHEDLWATLIPSNLTSHFRHDITCWLTKHFLQYSTILIQRKKEKENDSRLWTIWFRGWMGVKRATHCTSKYLFSYSQLLSCRQDIAWKPVLIF